MEKGNGQGGGGGGEDKGEGKKESACDSHERDGHSRVNRYTYVRKQSLLAIWHESLELAFKRRTQARLGGRKNPRGSASVVALS